MQQAYYYKNHFLEYMCWEFSLLIFEFQYSFDLESLFESFHSLAKTWRGSLKRPELKMICRHV